MNDTKEKHATHTVLYGKIKERGRLSISKLSVSEIIDAMKLNDEGLIKFDRTRKGNVSRFLVVKEV